MARNGHVERVCKIGDLNLDGKIDSNDITKLQSFLTTGKAEFPLQAADADENRVINENDITALQNIINKGSSNLGHAVLNPYNITSPINSNITRNNLRIYILLSLINGQVKLSPLLPFRGN